MASGVEVRLLPGGTLDGRRDRETRAEEADQIENFHDIRSNARTKTGCVKGNEIVTLLRATVGLLILSTGCTILLAGSGSPCKGDFCVDISSSFYSNEPCIGDATKSCTYANVYFTAKSKNVHITTPAALTVEMSINDRRVGVEGSSKLTTSNGLVVQLLLDRSYSITESMSTTAVRNGASQFVRSLGNEALISVSVFASETSVPLFVVPGSMSTTTTQTLYNKTTAESMVQQYSSYTSATSDSQTKLYDAVGTLGGKKPTGSGADRLQNVLVVFTDGADTASSKFTNPEGVRAELGSKAPLLKVYAIGLGAEPNADALGKISSDRFYRAANSDELQKAFDEVSKELTAIYLYKVLVASVESNATGRLKVTYDTVPVEQTFRMSSSTMSGSGGGGGSTDFTITVGTGTTPTFTWPGTVATQLEVVNASTSERMWSVTATGSGFSSGLKYGTTPSGGSASMTPRTLVVGGSYVVTVDRVDGLSSTKAFTR